MMAEFLKGKENFLIVKQNDSRKTYRYFKVHSEVPELVYLFRQYDKNKFMNPYYLNGRNNFIGIYNTKTDILYVENIFICSREPIFNTVKLVSIGEVYKEIVAKTIETINKIVDLNENNVEFCGKVDIRNIEKNARDIAYSAYMQDVPIDRDLVTFHDIELNTDILISYLHKPEEAILKLAQNTIKKKAKSIVYRVKTIQLAEEKLQEYEKMQLDKEKKRILKAIPSKFRTLTIEILKNGINFICEIYNAIEITDENIDYWHIDSKDERDIYKKIFGHENIKFDEIIRISYGKKVLYEKEN